MKIFPVTFLFLTGFSLFGSNIGSTSFGFGFGDLNFENDTLGSKTTIIDTNIWSLHGSFNGLDSQDRGFDIVMDFYYGSNGEENTISKFDASFRPYLRLGEIVLFAKIGASRIHVVLDDEKFYSERSFIPSVGAQFSLGKLKFTPSLDYVDYDMRAKGIMYSLPLAYSITDYFFLKFEYLGSFLDDYNNGGLVFQENELNSWTLGLDLLFK